MPPLADVRRQALAALRSPPRLQLSVWIEANILLPDGMSALPGPVRLWPAASGRNACQRIGTARTRMRVVRGWYCLDNPATRQARTRSVCSADTRSMLHHLSESEHRMLAQENGAPDGVFASARF